YTALFRTLQYLLLLAYMHSPSLFTPRLLISPYPVRAVLRKKLASTSKEVEAFFFLFHTF
ncbi:hypothetical protein ACT4UT_34215, partial [Bacillus sp. B-TM1]